VSAKTVEAIIVSYNTREILRNALASIRKHQPPEQVATLSVAVFDNASTDGSADMVEADFPEVRLVRGDRNLGYGPGNNHLAGTSTADYVMLLNSDVVLIEDVVELLVSAMDSEPSAILASPRLVFPDGRVQYSAHALPNLRFEYAECLRGTRLARLLTPIIDAEKRALAGWERSLTDHRISGRRPGFVWATCWLIRRTDIEEFGLFDDTFPMYDLDMDYCRRAVDSGRTLLYVPDVEMIHLGGSSSTSAAKAKLMKDGRRAYYRRHGGRLVATAYDVGTACLDAAVRATAVIPKPRVTGGDGR
jgi:GT2 family glycosyltransferase